MEIFKLGELPEKQIASFGNKAAGLNKLSQYGFNVPSGYAISNKEFYNFLKHNKGFCRHCEGRSNLSKKRKGAKDRRAAARDDVIFRLLVPK